MSNNNTSSCLPVKTALLAQLTLRLGNAQDHVDVPSNWFRQRGYNSVTISDQNVCSLSCCGHEHWQHVLARKQSRWGSVSSEHGCVCVRLLPGDGRTTLSCWESTHKYIFQFVCENFPILLPLPPVLGWQAVPPQPALVRVALWLFCAGEALYWATSSAPILTFF